jgi:predicted SAM-dependent methyltransferase
VLVRGATPMNQAIDVINAVLTGVKRSRRVLPNGKPVKVNFGSSLFVENGWINVEGSLHAFVAKWPTVFQRFLYRRSKANEWFGSEEEYIRVLKTHCFVHHDLNFGLPFADDSVDYLYASHILEHFYPDLGERILRDAHRVLKKGGRIRICVPDLKHAVDLYLAGQKECALEYFFRDSKPRDFYRHRYMYDFELLGAALRKAGFSSVEEQSYQHGRVPDVEKLDNRPEETLYVEAVK